MLTPTINARSTGGKLKCTKVQVVVDPLQTTNPACEDPESSPIPPEIADANSTFISVSDFDRKSHRFYQPASTRTWVLLAFLFSFGLCVMLLEYVITKNVHEPEVQIRLKRSATFLGNTDIVARELSVAEASEHSSTSFKNAAVASSVGITSTRYLTWDVISIPTNQHSVSYLSISSSSPNYAPVTSTSHREAPTTSKSRWISTSRSARYTNTTRQDSTWADYESELMLIDTPKTTSAPKSLPTPSVGVLTDEPVTSAKPLTALLLIADETSEDSRATADGIISSSKKAIEAVSHSPSKDPPGALVSDSGVTNDDVQQSFEQHTSMATGGVVPSPSKAKDGVSRTTSRVPQGVVISESGLTNDDAQQSSEEPTGFAPASAQIEPGVISLKTTQILCTSSIAAGTAAVIKEITLFDNSGLPTETLAYVMDLTLTESVSGSLETLLGDAHVVLTDQLGRPTATLSAVMDIVVTDEHGIPTKTISYTPLTTQSGSLPSSSEAFSEQSIQAFTEFDYFLAMYLPMLIGVVLQSAWLILFATLRTMEPFYQLANPKGASASVTVTADYLSTGLSLNFFKDAFRGQWVLFCACLVQFSLSAIVTLASGAINVKPTAFCTTQSADKQPCAPALVLRLNMVRVMEAFFGAACVLVVIIILLSSRRISGIYNDPTKIATMADLLTHSPMIQELRRVSMSGTKRQMEQALSKSRYALGTVGPANMRTYGIIKLEVDHNIPLPPGERRWYQTIHRKIKSHLNHLGNGLTLVSDSMPFLPDAVCASLISLLAGVILAYWCIQGPGAFNEWMNGDHLGPGGLGPSVVLTAVGVLIGFFVKSKEQLIRLSRPYSLLSKAPAKSAADTITASIHGTQFASVCKSVRARDVSLGLMSFAAILSDLLLIMVRGVPFSEAQTLEVFRASTWSCLGMLGCMLIAQVRIIYKDFKRGKRLYFAYPDTISTVLIRLCASKFVEDKNDLQDEWWTEKTTMLGLGRQAGDCEDRLQAVRYGGHRAEKRYNFTWGEGVDGVKRFMIDEVKR